MNIGNNSGVDWENKRWQSEIDAGNYYLAVRNCKCFY